MIPADATPARPQGAADPPDPPPTRAAFLLCGGLGTRLREVTDRPKGTLDVAGWPFLRYHIASLAGARLERLVFLTGHGAQEIECYFGPPSADRIFMREDEPLGTAGALAAAAAADHAGETNYVANGDSFSDVAPEEILRAAHPAEALVLAVRLEERSDYGSLVIDDGGMVRGFEEKGGAGPGWINAGVYVLPRAFLLEMRHDLRDGPGSLERDFLPRWAREGRLRAHRAEAFFRDIGTPERLAAAQTEFIPIRRRLEGAAGRPPRPPR